MSTAYSAPVYRPAGYGDRRPHRIRRLIGLLVLLALLGAGLYAGLLARDVWNETNAGRSALNQGLALLDVSQLPSLTPHDLAAAAADFRRAQRSLSQARARLGFWGDWATAHANLLPGPAKQLAAAAPLLDLGRDTAAAATTLSAGLVPVTAALHDPAPVPYTRLQSSYSAIRPQSEAPNGDTFMRLTAALSSARPALAHAGIQLDIARADRRRLAGLPRVAAAASLLATFDRRAPQLADALIYAQGLPDLLGAHGARSYLLVYQDAADLRATGGFIGAAALLTLDHGRLSQIDYETTGAAPGPNNLQLPFSVAGAPPQPLFYYRDLSSFQFRDANFWPDFPTSARHIADRYLKATGRHIDGVIAATPAAISYLLGALGPLSVPGFPETISAATAVDRIEYYSHNRPGAASDPHRNRFLVVVSHTVLDRLLRASGAQVSDIVSAVERGFADRSIMLSVDDPLFARALGRAHWDGALRSDPGDYLGVYDQNVTDSKLNPFVDQAIAYTATRQADGSLRSQVTITYSNHTTHTSAWIARTYYEDYLRVAVPGGSVVQGQDNYDETFWPNEMARGRLLIAGGFLVPAGGSRTVSITYRVPATALADVSGYRLLVQQQPGRRPPTLSVQVNAGGRTWSAHITLRRDTVFSTPWSAPIGALRVRIGA